MRSNVMLLGLLAGCSSSHAEDAGADAAATSRVGMACEVGSVPFGGFDAREIYLEYAGPACGDDMCMVYMLDGDPRSSCIPADCADPAEIDARVFCTCRCSGTDPGAEYCDCPADMTCVPNIVSTGGADLRGGYCVRSTIAGG